MKKILITGMNSYIGNSVEDWLMKEPGNYKVDKVDMKQDSWREKDFSSYDVVFHVAGIAHVSSDPKMEDLYYKVNRDLTIETAKKSKADGVKQFIFMSSIIVYGDSSTTRRVINEHTLPNPSNFYGDSKLQAEEGIIPLESKDFKITIIRPPMVYGKGSKGNYQKLAKLSKRISFFPDIDNKRSMVHINNLCQFVKLSIDDEAKGIYFPQNREYVNTSKLVKKIANCHGNDVKLIKLFNPLINILSSVTLTKKIFGSLVYSFDLSVYPKEYNVIDFEDSIENTEGRKS